jgi:uncharacterized protein (TIRG00374 family)
VCLNGGAGSTAVVQDRGTAYPVRDDAVVRPGWKKVLRGALPVAVIAVVFLFVLPRIADFGDVLDTFGKLRPMEIALLAGVTIVNIATFAPPWMAALPGLSYLQAMQLTMASTALANAAPGGDAAGMAMSYRMLRAWGMAPTGVAVAVAATGAWNQFVNVGIPVLSAGALALSGQQDPFLTTAALIGLAVLIAVGGAVVAGLRSEIAAHRIGAALDRVVREALRLVGRRRPTGIEQSVVRFRGESAELIRTRWLPLTVWTLVGHLTVFAVLLVALRTLGVTAAQVSVLEALASWSLVRLLTAIPITPGGIGIVELGLTTALVGFGGHNEDVVAAVLLYRALTFLPPLPLGALAALTWRRMHPGEMPLAAGE